MSFKLTSTANYIHIEDTEKGKKWWGTKSKVEAGIYQSSDDTYVFKNLNGPTSSLNLLRSDMIDENDLPISKVDLESFIDTNTGFNTALGGSSANNFSGWAQYSDTQYTDVSPLVVNADPVNFSDLPNNGGNTLEIQKPIDVSTFYDPTTQKILGRNGDGISIAIEINATPSSNNAWIEMAVDIGGSVGRIYPDTISFPRGANVSRSVIYKINSGYTLGTWEANGGVVKFRSNVNLSIHSIRYVITRTHKAR